MRLYVSITNEITELIRNYFNRTENNLFHLLQKISTTLFEKNVTQHKQTQYDISE